MTNAERRQHLNFARDRANDWAQRAEERWPEGNETAHEYVEMANMWANVAQALKTANHDSDGVLHPHEY